MWESPIFIANWMGLKGPDRASPSTPRWVRRPASPESNGRFSRNGRKSPRLELDPFRAEPPPWYAPPQPTPAQRALNIAVAVIGIAVTAPLMLLIAALVKLTSPGPVLFTQPRVGVDRRRHTPGVPIDPRRRVDHGGRIFRIYKFRTMEHTPEQGRQQVWASPEDPRITPVGRVLRQYRLDELPQLFNVLLGDMNVVGPRPEQPRIFKELRTRVDGYERRQRVLPGITGLAQVNRHYDQCIEDVERKVQLDLCYVERQCLLEDLRIMLRTFPVILFRRGAC